MTRAAGELVLASGSKTRARLLCEAGVPFRVIQPTVDETAIKQRLLREGASGERLAAILAECKAAAGTVLAPGALVLGADQVLELDGQIFDKPGDRAAARAQLLALAGRRHCLVAAVAAMQDGALVWRHADSAWLDMRPLTHHFIDGYLDAAGQAVLDSVGGYQLEALGAQLFRRIDGDYFTILGLPLLPLLDFWRSRGILAT